MPSIKHADGWGITYAACLFFWSSFAKVALFLLRNVPSGLASVHGSGPRGWARTLLVWKFLHSAMTIICANNLFSALRTASWLLEVLTFIFLLRSVKVMSLVFFMVSWNFTFGGSHSRR